MSWQPIAEPSSPLANRAWDAIDAVVCDLRSAEADAGPGAVRDASRLPLLLTYLWRAGYYDAAALDAVEAGVGGAIEDAQGLAHRLGLFGGLPGLGWIVEHVSRVACSEDDEAAAPAVTDDGDDPLEAIDDALLRHLAAPEWRGPYDLIGGLVALGTYFLERAPRPAAREGLDRVLAHLERQSRWDGPGLTWHTAPELLPEWQREACPNGYYNLGVAHGVPGVVGFLGGAIEAGIEAPRATGILAPTMDWLMAQGEPGPTISRFSSWVVPGRPRTEGRQTWCYGDLGVLVVLDRVAAVTGRADWRRFADGLREHCLRRDALPVPPNDILDAPLCHGATGVGHLFNRLYQRTGDARCRDAACRWIERALDMRQPGSGVGGFTAATRTETGGVTQEARPDFLDGATGVALGLLAALTDVPPEWDRLLLLSGRRTPL